ncbi:hypothetical protein HHI36_021021 [Cryptolaemus montrouzieri]
MGLTTITSARIYAKGEAGFLAWEKFKHIAVLKTYSNNQLVPDSSSTGTALFSGVKVNHKTVGVDGSVQFEDCEASLDPKVHTSTIFDWAMEAGKSTGFVTTTRVTHATPASLYAHIASRKWESEAEMVSSNKKCKDIARQLIEDLPGRNIKVIMGGGRQMLQSNASDRPGDPIDTWATKSGDNRDLMADWKIDKQRRNVSNAIVTNNEELDKLSDSTEYVLGIFANGHLAQDYRRNRGPEGMPSLRNMSDKAIKLLRKNKKGYVLMVEGGLIDASHHRGHARQALEETKVLSEAVESALSMVDLNDTLVIVTSDHSHSLSFVGYLERNKSILGVTNIRKRAPTPYTSLLYSIAGKNNFQYTIENGEKMVRRDPSLDKTEDFEYSQQTGIVIDEAPHGGTDVLLYAAGPMSHLVHSVREQTFVAYLISYAAKIGPSKDLRSAAATNRHSHFIGIIVILKLCFISRFC